MVACRFDLAAEIVVVVAAALVVFAVVLITCDVHGRVIVEFVVPSRVH